MSRDQCSLQRAERDGGDQSAGAGPDLRHAQRPAKRPA